MLEDRDGQVAPGHVALEQHLAVIGKRGDQRGRDVGRRARELDPQGRALRGRLDDNRKLQPLLDLGQRLGGAEFLERGLVEGVEVRGRDAAIAHCVLRQHLVERADAGRDTGAGVGDAHHLEDLLHRAVLSVAAMERDECHVGGTRAQLLDEVGSDIDRGDLVPEPLERVLDPGPGLQ